LGSSDGDKFFKLLLDCLSARLTKLLVLNSVPLAEYQKYLTICNCDYDGAEDCLKFWQRQRKELPTLYKVATKVHSVPATSAPIERVFSHGGVIMRPHHDRLLDSTLSNLIFLKCNNI
jgi:hAT family C-terminal dimerisation region